MTEPRDENPTDTPTGTPTDTPTGTPTGAPPPGAGGRRADRSGAAPEGRRGASLSRRLDVVVVLALVLPSVSGLSLALTPGGDLPAPTAGAPTDSMLRSAQVVCPGPVGRDAGDVVVGRAPGVEGGEVLVRTAVADPAVVEPVDPVAVAPEAIVPVPDSDAPVVLSGEGAAAPGMVAGRSEPGAIAECRPTSYDEWLVGLGAAAKNSSVIELVNPDAAPAVVEVALQGPHGLIEEDALRGVQVPGHGVKLLDLAEIAPRRVDLAAHLTVTRGRIMATARHTYDPLGRGAAKVDYLPAQAEPSTQNVILGVPVDAGQRTLFLANPGDDETRATVRLLTEDAVFTPSGLDEVIVPAHGLSRVRLSAALKGKVAKGVLGIVVESADPLAAGVRAIGADELGLYAPVAAEDDVLATVLPEGAKRLLLAEATNAGVVRVTATDGGGKVLLDEEPVEVAADRAATLDLPDAAVLLVVEARNTPIAAVVSLLGTPRAPVLATLRLRAPQIRAQVPAVSPQ